MRIRRPTEQHAERSDLRSLIRTITASIEVDFRHRTRLPETGLFFRCALAHLISRRAAETVMITYLGEVPGIRH
jgi:hypothetical protein